MHIPKLTLLCALFSACVAIVVPSTAPANASAVNSALLSLSIEFFAFPGYTELSTTGNCIATIASLRGASPAVRIGGTTQDRATYDANLATAVNYTVASPADAPDSLTYGPEFFELASQLTGDLTLGLNRQLDNQTNGLAAARRAQSAIPDLFAVELGNEPDLYAGNSPIAGGKAWTESADVTSESDWFNVFAQAIGSTFQGAVYLSTSWSIQSFLTDIGDSVRLLKSISRHSYPQSACGGASTNLQELMSHSGIVSYTRQYESEATATHQAGRQYFLGETNSATCGGGGISPTFGAALWIVDYVLQGAVNGIDRLYFHQGTISNCAYCFWGENVVFTPFYGAAFVSEFLGSDGERLAMLDSGTSPIGVYAVFAASGAPVRLLVVNSNYYDGTGTRANATVSFAGLPTANGTFQVKRLSAPAATSQANEGAAVAIGGDGVFDSNCILNGGERTEGVAVSGNTVSVTIPASESLIVYL